MKKKYLLSNKKQNIEEDKRDLVGKNSDNKSRKNMLPRHIIEDRFFVNE